MNQLTIPEVDKISLEESLLKNGCTWGDPVYLRIVKVRHLLQLWMLPKTEVGGSYHLIKTYPILSMSGRLGPKERQGDLQAPEGFYETRAVALNPHSKYHLSFNVGYPNDYDLSQQRTGDFIMVHGKDKSQGCFAMGDSAIEEIYSMVEAYVKQSPQHVVPIEIYPFEPSYLPPEMRENSPYYRFWQHMLKAWDWTELHHRPYPKEKQYQGL